jgi:hypothetical protein
MILLKMIAANRPLHEWPAFAETATADYYAGGGWRTKELDRIAAVTVASLSHPLAVELVAKEWEALPSVVRMRLTQLANERHEHPQSNNQRKGIIRLDRLLDGKILSAAPAVTTSELRVIGGCLVRQRRTVRAEVAGAMRAFGAFAKPKDFASWSPARKRQWQQRAAAERRRAREGR